MYRERYMVHDDKGECCKDCNCPRRILNEGYSETSDLPQYQRMAALSATSDRDYASATSPFIPNPQTLSPTSIGYKVIDNPIQPLWGGAEGDEAVSSDEPTSDESSTESTSEFVSGDEEEMEGDKKKKHKKDKKKRKKKEEAEDKSPSDLEVDEETSDEQGRVSNFVVSSSINSSDLYRMQSRVFASETESYTSLTDEVNRALNRIHKRKLTRQDVHNGMFDTSEEEIMDLRRVSTRRNPKYA